MPEMLPGCLKPTDVGRTSGGSDEQKAKRYRELRPGVKVSDETAANRMDLMHFRDKNGIINRRRKTTVGRVSFSGLSDNLWCECGKFKHEGECQ